jgi:hypothetical protein
MSCKFIRKNTQTHSIRKSMLYFILHGLRKDRILTLVRDNRNIGEILGMPQITIILNTTSSAFQNTVIGEKCTVSHISQL